ncbi:MAG: DUF11 domain-containing protein [Leptolyngbya sp. Prado105]|jgi:uncharacterized repeat protein (TIGR01451 family)|nr:DUF11 domain-containing protein [Leptolyngbya sp. Prado105]
MKSFLRYLIQRFAHKLTYQSLFVLYLAIGGYLAEPGRTEGSKELTSQGGNRPFLLYHSTANSRPTIGSIPLRTTIKVYVNAGETINLGSSANGIGSGRINYRPPTGTSGSCATNEGVISNRAQEVAGPLPNTGGYTPCIITSTQTTAAGSGVWEIDFISPNPASDNNPTGLLATANWTQSNNVGWVAAWDVTVRNGSTGSPIPGRVFANSLAIRIPPSSASFSPLLYVQTQEGYRYLVNPRNLDPFTFVFFANNNGFKSATTNLPLYRSVLFPGGTGLESGVTVHDPNAPDSGNNVTHKLFLNSPSLDLPAFAFSPSGMTWLLQDPIPPQPTGLAFTGIEGTPGQAGTSPLGGSFSFNSNVTGRYQLTLDINNDGIYGNSNDRILSGFATIGGNTIFWDGRDNAATAVPASAVPYGAQIVLYAGEIHFPLLDAEQNPSGFTIQRVNAPMPPTIPAPDPYRVFFDDQAVGGASATNGVNSSSGAHSWTSGFGDNKGIDTWTYYPSGVTQLNGGIGIKQADLEVVSIASTPTIISAGSPITYTITVRNNGPIDTTGADFVNQVPAAITGVTWTCSVSPADVGNSCGAASGSGNDINTTLDLKNGATATYVVTGTVSTAGAIANTARILRSNDITDPDDINRTGAGNNSKTSNVTAIANTTLSVSGTVFHDYSANGVLDTDLGNDVGTNAGSSSLTVYAVNASAQVVSKATVAANGSYTLTNLPANSSFTLRLSNDSSVNVGATAPTAPSLPSNWYHTSENLNGTIDAEISTLGSIALTTTTTNLTNQNFGIRQGYVIAPDPAPTICNPDYSGALNTGISTTGGQLPVNTLDLNWSVEWLNASIGSAPYATARPVGPMPAVVVGNLAVGAWVNEPPSARWISYPFRLSNNNNGFHPDADFDGRGSELTTGGFVGTSDAVRLRYTANVTLPANANTISISLPIGVSSDNRFMSVRVNGVENFSPLPVQNPEALDFRTTQTVNITQGWQTGVNTIEILTDSGPDYTGFFLQVEATTTQVCASPNVSLVKRITAINGQTSTQGGDNLALYKDEPTNPYDDNTITIPTQPNPTDPPTDTDKWLNLNTFMIGGTDGGFNKPGDELEYTMYFLSSGDGAAENVLFCDRVPTNVTFTPTGFNTGVPADPNGLSTADRGIVVNIGGNSLALTGIADGDRARYFPPGTEPSSIAGLAGINCGGANTNGAIVVNLGNLPNATAPGSPAGSYGFVRFRARVR